jgi:hypothetical protein
LITLLLLRKRLRSVSRVLLLLLLLFLDWFLDVRSVRMAGSTCVAMCAGCGR